MVFHLEQGEGNVIATAIHSGHQISHELEPHINISPQVRLKEEDPLTDLLARVAGISLVVKTSRFEVDLNRSPHKCVYSSSGEAWGLEVWKAPLPQGLIERARLFHDHFYAELEKTLLKLIKDRGRLLLLDLHSYVDRDGYGTSPTIDLGTESVDKSRWGDTINKFKYQIRKSEFSWGSFDVFENYKFTGGYLPRWVNERFGQDVLAISVEVNKYYCNYETGEFDIGKLREIESTLSNALKGLAF